MDRFEKEAADTIVSAMKKRGVTGMTDEKGVNRPLSDLYPKEGKKPIDSHRMSPRNFPPQEQFEHNVYPGPKQGSGKEYMKNMQ